MVMECGATTQKRILLDDTNIPILYRDEDCTLYRTRQNRYYLRYEKNTKVQLYSKYEAEQLLIEKVGEEEKDRIFDEAYSHLVHLYIRDRKVAEYLKKSSEQHFMSASLLGERILRDYVDKQERGRR